MKILLVNTYTDNGGAAIAVRRLAQALKSSAQNLEIAILSLYPFSPEKKPLGVECQSLASSFSGRLYARLCFVGERAELFCRNGLHREHLFDLSPSRWGWNSINHHPLVAWADVVHLHWINHGFLSLRALQRLGQINKPIVFTMHDMWVCTSAAHHQSDPDQYISPWFGKENRFIERIGQKKELILKELAPTLIGCSHWITQKAKAARTTTRLRSVSIPNAIDIHQFSPLSKEATTRSRNNTRHLLLGAVHTSDPRKGFKEFVTAVRILDRRGTLQRHKVVWDIFGQVDAPGRELLQGLPIRFHGYLNSEDQMIALYRKSDALIVPSLFENLPNTIMESLACGTPVVAFATGGIPEMIQDQASGYVCSYGDPQALADGIEKLLSTPSDCYQRMRQEARRFACEHYAQSIVAKQHIELYRSLLSI